MITKVHKVGIRTTIDGRKVPIWGDYLTPDARHKLETQRAAMLTRDEVAKAYAADEARKFVGGCL